MNQKVNWKLVLLFGAGFVIGGLIFSGGEKVVEKEVVKEVPVIKEVVKEAECPANVTSVGCDDLQHNYLLCGKALQASGEVNKIAGEIFGNITYYINNPEKLYDKSDEISKQAELIKEYKSQLR